MRNKRKQKIKFNFDDQETLDCDTHAEPPMVPEGRVTVRLGDKPLLTDDPDNDPDGFD